MNKIEYDYEIVYKIHNPKLEILNIKKYMIAGSYIINDLYNDEIPYYEIISIVDDNVEFKELFITFSSITPNRVVTMYEFINIFIFSNTSIAYPSTLNRIEKLKDIYI